LKIGYCRGAEAVRHPKAKDVTEINDTTKIKAPTEFFIIFWCVP